MCDDEGIFDSHGFARYLRLRRRVTAGDGRTWIGDLVASRAIADPNETCGESSFVPVIVGLVTTQKLIQLQIRLCRMDWSSPEEGILSQVRDAD